MHLQVQQHREMQVATLQMMGIPSARDRLPTLTEEQNACSHNVYHAEGNASYHGWKCKLCGARLCYMPTRNTLQNLQMRQKEQLQRRRRSATSAAMPSTREIQLMNARVQANQDLSDRLEAETAIGMALVSGSAAIQDLARVLEHLGVQLVPGGHAAPPHGEKGVRQGSTGAGGGAGEAKAGGRRGEARS